MEKGVNDRGAEMGLFRVTVYEYWKWSHSPYLWRIRWKGAILGENNIILFGEDLVFPFLQGIERYWDSSQYSDYAIGWTIHGLNCDRCKRCSFPKCPDQLWDPTSLPQLHIQWVLGFYQRDTAAGARRWSLTSIHYQGKQWVKLYLYCLLYAFIAMRQLYHPNFWDSAEDSHELHTENTSPAYLPM